MHRPAAFETNEEQGLFFPELERNRGSGAAGAAKNFVLDTNVLLHDPHCLNRFENNHVFIPVDVLTELDAFKNEQSERGANARQAHRFLSAIFRGDPASVTGGAQTVGGGTVRILVDNSGEKGKQSAAMRRFHRIFPDQDRMDHRIMGAALALQERGGAPTALVTKDLNMQLRAMSIGLPCEDYLNDKVGARDAEGSVLREAEVEAHELQRFGSSGTITLPVQRTGELDLNEYILLRAAENKLLPARHAGGGVLKRLNIPAGIQIPRGIELKPVNPGQQCFLDALLDPSIALVTCYGQAGTGKTLLAVAAGLYQTGRRDFNGMTVSRPVVAMGDTLGFLPGTLNEKMHPWLQSIYDACEVLMPLNPPGSGKNRKADAAKKEGPAAPAHQPVVKPYEQLMERGLLEIEALCYIRGRSIPNRFFVLDEAQQLTPLEAKTVVTRMSRGSKLVMVGDPAQIDNPYVDSRSNGLVYTRNKLRGQSLTAHIRLTKGERSPLAELGAGRM
ncbi:MAG: PhoH family protein [Verrucomicrobia bacterium]|nr:PhoH family protein [Verrucomicrobiota bacterium]